MSSASKIEWTEQTWNPIAGCTILTPGCKRCYAMGMAKRLAAMGKPLYADLTETVNGHTVWTGEVRQAPEATLLAPLRRKKPTMYFVNSMSDLFHESVPDEWIDKVFAVMRDTPQHTYQVLTKRAERMRAYCTERFEREAGRQADNQILNPYPVPILPNVWLGVSTERQQEADERIPHLLQTPAAVRFISAEPLLGPIDLSRWMPVKRYYNAICEKCGHTGSTEHFREARYHDDADVVCPKCEQIILAEEIGKLDWVIVGGESGPGARPMSIQWARELRDQCKAAGVPFFFKQWGEWAPAGSQPEGAPGRFAFGDFEHDRSGFVQVDGYPRQFTKFGSRSTLKRVGKKAAGRLLDGIEHNAMPGRVA
jgi:protein gp37